MTNPPKNHSKIGQILSDNIDDLIFILNEKYNCEYINFQHYPFSKKINDYVHPHDFKRVSRLLKDIFRTGYGSEEVQLKYNGTPYKWFEIKGKSFLDSEDSKRKTLLICRDISKYKKLELDLIKSKASVDEITDTLPEIQFWRLLQSRKGINVVQQTSEMIQLVFDNIPQLICWKDTNLVYRGCNKNFALLNKLTEPIIIIGRKDEDLVWHNGNFHTFIEKEQKVIKNDKPQYNAIESIIFSDNNQAWFEINRIPLHDSKNNVVGILITYENITLRKLTEQELNKSQEELTVLNRELEQKVLERSKDLIKSEQQYRTTINSLSDPIHVINKNLEIILSNNAFNSWLVDLGIETQFVNKKVLDAFPFLPDEVYREYKEVFSNGKIIITEGSINLNGKEIFTETRKIPIFSEGIVNQVITIIRDITEKIKSEQELKESEEKFRNISEQSLMGIFIIQDGLLKYFNKRVAETSGYSIDEIKNWPPNEFVQITHPEDREFVMEQARKKQAGDPDVVNQYVYRIIRRDGETRWIELFSKTISFKGHPADLAMTHDITDKIMAEHELKESEEKFRIITEQSLVGISIIQDGKYKYFNKRLCEMNGYSEEEIKSWSSNEFEKTVYPEDREFVMEQAYKKQAGNQDIVIHYRYRAIRKDGEIQWREIYSKTITYKDHPADLILSIDVSDKVKAEQKLKKSEENFQDMIVNLEEGYYKVEWEGNLVYHNPAFNKIAGYDIHENLIGQPPPFYWENYDEWEVYLKKLQNDGFIRNYILPLKKKNEEKIVAQINARLIKDDNNNPIAIEGTLSDVTEKFRLEQELLESEKKLRQQNIELKKLDKVKNDFITMAAHELKTPLISISGYTDYILMKHRDQLNTEVTRDMLIVQRNVKRLEILMDQLLDVMKIDENKLKLQKELVNISKIINDCLDELSYLINEKNLEVILNFEHEILIDVDPMRISTVFTNLLSNAIKYTPDYGWLEIFAVKKDNEYIFKVKDNGIGLTQDEIGKLFKKFERIKPPISNKNINIKDSGTGLGLYITKGIINTHGGRIWAKSKGLYKGSTFIFSLPI